MSQNICNICGANYEYHNGRWKCPACGAFKAEELSNEEVTLLYNAAQKLRLSDFDEAEKAYADIIAKYPQNSEGYWGRLLSRFGIKYEEDFDGKQIPTCYAAIESITSDKDYTKAIALADEDTKAYYLKQAEYIERVRKEWVEKARKEKPYDIFISYKDSDAQNGMERTKDSIAAQELYMHLTSKGYRVFFSRESLRDKVGEKYEPYIFGALSTAKVMLVYGCSSEYITSTWVKNEWTRYQKRIESGEKKPNSLLVACDGFSPSELPKTLASKQCFDANNRSFYTDLEATLEKIIKGEHKPKMAEPVKAADKRKLVIAITTAVVAIATMLCILIPNLLSNKDGVTSLTNSQYSASVVISNGEFPNGTVFNVEEMKADTQVKSIISSLPINQSNYHVYDMSLREGSTEIDVEGNVVVTMPLPSGINASKAIVYYISGTTSEDVVSSVLDGKISFTTSHFSIYVIAEKTKYTITFDSNGGSGTMNSISMEAGTSTNLPANSFTKAGYTFIGWSDVQGGDVKYTDRSSFKMTSPATVTLYAVWSASSYTVTYEDTTETKDVIVTLDYNCNDLDASTVILTDGQVLTRPDNPTRSGYVFTGWYTDNACTNRYNFAGTITTDVTLYAGWCPQFTDGCSNTIIDPTSYGSSIYAYEHSSFDTSVSCQDYIYFVANESGTHHIYYKNGSSDQYRETCIGVTNLTTGEIIMNTSGCRSTSYKEVSFACNAGDVIVINLYKTHDYHFVYFYYGGFDKAETSTATAEVPTGAFMYRDDSTHTSNYTYGVEYNLIIPTRVGYTFNGWFYDINFQTPCHTIPSDSIGNKTLYASWSANTNSINFNANGGSGNMPAQQIKTDEKVTLNSNLFTREGYTFVGWATSAEGSVEYQNQSVYTMGNTSPYVLYAVWSPITYTATFKNGNTVVKEVSFTVETVAISAPAVPVKQCYSGSWSDYEIIADDIVIYAEYKLAHSGIAKVQAKEAQCNATGNIEYWHCAGCDNNYTSADGTTLATDITIDPVSCDYVDGECRWCGSSGSFIEDFIFEDAGDYTYTLTSYIGEDKVVVIPDTYQGKPITSIADNAFKNCIIIESVSLNNNITSIGISAFENCTALKTIVLSTKLTSIGSSAFKDCTLLEMISIPLTVTTIGTGAFANCANLDNVIVPSGIETIQSETFKGCTSLENITLLEGIKVIEHHAFQDCKGLKKLVIPESVNEIDWGYGSGILNGCSSLETLVIPIGTIEVDWRNKHYLFSVPIIFGTTEYENSFVYECIPKYYTTNNYGMGKYEEDYWGKLDCYIPNSLKEIYVGVSSGEDFFKNYDNITVYWGYIYGGFKVDFDLNDSNATQNTYKFVELGETYTFDVPAREGYEFAGWYYNNTQITGSDGVTFNTWSISTDCTLTAKWTANTYTVTFEDTTEIRSEVTVTFDYNYNGSTSSTVTLTNGQTLNYPTVPTRSGHAFAGWYTDSNCTTIYAFSGHITEDITLYARWVYMTDTYSLTEYVDIANYNSSSSTKSITSSSPSSPSYYYFTCYKSGIYDFYVTHTSGDFYICVYNVSQSYAIISTYNLSGSYSNKSVSFTANAGDVIYVSAWTNASSSTGYGTFYVSGASYPTSTATAVTGYLYEKDTTASVTIAYDDTLMLPIPTRTGYTFDGWYDEMGKDVSLVWVWKHVNNVTLTAKWTANENTIVFNSNGGSGTMTDVKINTDSTLSLPTRTFTREGYTFIGWSTSAQGGVEYTDGDDFTIGTESTVTLYAVWQYGSEGLVYESGAVVGYTGTDTTVFIPSTYNGVAITSIGKKENIEGLAFNNNTAVKEIVLPDTITTIGFFAFSGCSNLENINIPDAVTYIGVEAFSYCGKLKEVTIPYGCLTMGSYVFSYSSATIYCEIESKVEADRLGDWADNWNATDCVVYWGYSNVEYSEGLSYSISDDYTYFVVTGIGSCTDEHIVVPGTYQSLPVTKIEANAFSHRTSIKSIVISEGIVEIGEWAFWRCTNLEKIVIPSTVSKIGEYAFIENNNLDTIVVTSGNSNYHSKNNCLIETKTKTLICGSNNSLIPNDGSVTKIAKQAFDGRSNLTYIVIPKYITEIGYQAFENCVKLEEVVFDEGIQLNKIGDYAFSHCEKLNFNIPDSVQVIGDHAFSYCKSFISIVIPKNVQTIGASSFLECASLETVYFEQGSKLTTIGHGAFYKCSKLKAFIIPQSTTTIGESAFLYTGLNTVFYEGSATEWKNKITIQYNNDGLSGATKYYYNENEPTIYGVFWRYIDGVPTIWQ